MTKKSQFKIYKCPCGKTLDGTMYWDKEKKVWLCPRCFLKGVPIIGEVENEKVKFYEPKN